MRFVIAALALAACGSVPPDTYSLAPSLTEGQQGAFRAAIGEWCALTDGGLCPQERPWGGRDSNSHSNVLLRADYYEAVDDPNTEATNWRDTNDIWVSPHLASLDLGAFYVASLHEIAHWCVEVHLKASPLMSPEHLSPEERLPTGEVDQVAIDAVKEWCGL